MAADRAAQPSDDAEPNHREPPTRFGRNGGANVENDTGEEHDLSYLRTRRARANDPRRSLSAAFAERNDPANPVVTLRREQAAPAGMPALSSAPRRLLLGRSRGFWVLSAALFALVAGATFGVFYSRQTWAERAAVAPEVVRGPAPTANSGLHMHVDVRGERVLVSWDPRASGVQGTKGGVLTIEDAGRRSQFPLDAEQAANGSVLYRPGSGDVTFRLEIHNASGAVFSDSLRVLDPAKAALEAQQKAPVQQPPDHVPEHVRIDASAKVPHVEAAGAKEKPTGRTHSGRPIARNIAPRTESTAAGTADPLTHMPAAAPAVLPPAQAVAGAALPSEFTQDAIASNLTPPAPPGQIRGKTTGIAIGKVSAAHASGAPAGQEGIFLPAQAVKQVMPKLRSSLLRTLPPGAKVGVVVSIDTHGRVKHAEIAPASRQIDIGVQRAVIDAAKEWRFAPAWRNGKKVDSEHTIFFQF